MATYVIFDIEDSIGRPSEVKFRVTDVVIPASIVTFMAAVAPAMVGAGKPSIGGITASKLLITDHAYDSNPSSVADIRNNWQMDMIDGTDADPWRTGIPARNPDASLLALGSVVLANVTVDPFLALQTALTGGTIKVQNPETGSDFVGFQKGISNVRGRKRPRVGGVR